MAKSHSEAPRAANVVWGAKNHPALKVLVVTSWTDVGARAVPRGTWRWSRTAPNGSLSPHGQRSDRAGRCWCRWLCQTLCICQVVGSALCWQVPCPHGSAAPRPAPLPFLPDIPSKCLHSYFTLRGARTAQGVRRHGTDPRGGVSGSGHGARGCGCIAGAERSVPGVPSPAQRGHRLLQGFWSWQHPRAVPHTKTALSWPASALYGVILSVKELNAIGLWDWERTLNFWSSWFPFEETRLLLPRGTGSPWHAWRWPGGSGSLSAKD